MVESGYEPRQFGSGICWKISKKWQKTFLQLLYQRIIARFQDTRLTYKSQLLFYSLAINVFDMQYYLSITTYIEYLPHASPVLGVTDALAHSTFSKPYVGRKSIWQNPTPFHDKSISKWAMEENFFNLMYGLQEHPTATILSGETECFSSKIKKKTWMSVLSTSIQLSTRVLVREIR